MTDRYYHMSFYYSLFHCQKDESEKELESLNESTLKRRAQEAEIGMN